MLKAVLRRRIAAIVRLYGDIYKIYAESFRAPAHLDAIVAEAQEIVAARRITARISFG